MSNKQDIEMIAENNEAAKSTESVQFRPEISGQELTEDMQHRRKQKNLLRQQIAIMQKQKKSRDHRHKTDHKKTGRNPGFLITVIVKQENKVCS